MIVLTQLSGGWGGSEFWFLVIQEIPERPPQKEWRCEKEIYKSYLNHLSEKLCFVVFIHVAYVWNQKELVFFFVWENHFCSKFPRD